MTSAKALFLSTFSFICCAAHAQTTTTGKAGVAVVELFTSEGCSSCPAAEAALKQVHDEYKEGVYVLEFHVDYWNYLGWKDMYSNAEYTQRQQRYAAAFQLSSTYTPQAVVNGSQELVGSDRSKLKAAINAGLHNNTHYNINLAASAMQGKVAVKYATEGFKGQLLNIALVQKNALTDVRRGENEGKKLQHINVVRALKTIDAGQQGTVSIDLPAGLMASDCSVIAYLQARGTLAISGAGACVVN